MNIEQNTCMILEPVDFPWNKGWALHENAAYSNRGAGKWMTDTIKKMLEQMYLLGNVHAKDWMTAKEMHDRLKEFADNSELEQDEIPKVSMIQGWISRYHKMFMEQATQTALYSNLEEDISTNSI